VVLRIVIVPLLIALAGGCATAPPEPEDAAEAPAPNVLRVGVAPDYPPIIYKTGGTITGLEAEMAQKLGEALGLQVRFVERTWTDLLPALERSQIDIIMSGMSVTRARATRCAFAKPYLGIGQMALVRRKDLPKYAAPWVVLMDKARTGVVKGTTGAYLAHERLQQATIVDFHTPEEAVRALLGGRVDLLIHDAPYVQWLAAQHEADGLAPTDFPLTTEYLAWAVRRGNVELLDAVNAELAKWYKDGSLNVVLARWLP
jgi:polar amino acid transport system substrate-binding protein